MGSLTLLFSTSPISRQAQGNTLVYVVKSKQILTHLLWNTKIYAGAGATSQDTILGAYPSTHSEAIQHHYHKEHIQVTVNEVTIQATTIKSTRLDHITYMYIIK